jgi:hypothetical protein
MRLRLAIAVCLAAASPTAAADGVDPGWFPLRAGAEWVYDVHRDQSYLPSDRSASRYFHKGRAVRVAVDAAERVPGGFEVRETLTLHPVAEGATSESLAARRLFSFRGELRMHASLETLADGSSDEVAYEKPLRLLPTDRAGETWNAGAFRFGAQSAALRGTAVGIADLPGTPAWPDCLEVRLEGTITGRSTDPSDRGEIESGTYERRIWFSRGVGIVREVTTTSLELLLSDGRRARATQVLTLRLLEHRVPR